jgi:hypothetical protein
MEKGKVMPVYVEKNNVWGQMSINEQNTVPFSFCIQIES